VTDTRSILSTSRAGICDEGGECWDGSGLTSFAADRASPVGKRRELWRLVMGKEWRETPPPGG